MPGVQRDAGAWDKSDAGTDSDTDSSDGRVVRVNMGDASDDEATPDEYRWLGDEHEDLGRVDSVPARLDGIGWTDDAFRAAALHGEGDSKFHEVLGRAAEASRSLDPYDPTCRSFYVRVDGVGFTNWSKTHGIAKPYDGAVHGAFVSAAAATMRHFRQKGLGVVAAYTQSDEVTFLCAGPAVLAGGASDPSRRLLTLFTSVFSKRFEQALRATKPEAAAEAFFEARVVAAATRSAGILALIWRRLDATRNASSQALRHLHGVRVQQELPPVDEALLADLTAGGVPEMRARRALMAGSATADAARAWLRSHAEGIDDPIEMIGRPHARQRLLLAECGTPWDTLPPALRYGTLLFAGDDRGRHVRLRVPRTRDEAEALERAIFDEQSWDTLGDAHPEAPAAAAAGPARGRPVPAARPAPAAPVIGPAPPAGFVRVDRGCPALDREGRDDRWCDAVETNPSQNAWGRLAERVANEFAGVLLWAKPVQPARSGDPSAGWRVAVLRLERVEPAGPTLTFAVEGAGFISQQKAAKHAAAASVAPLLDAALAADRANDVTTARQRARPLSILERLSQARSWPAPEPSGSDAVTWGPEGAVARAPRCAKGGGDKLQLAALVALRSLDLDAVAAAPVAPAPPPPPRPQEQSVPPPAPSAAGGRVLDLAIAICGDTNAGRRRDRGGREMTREEVDQLKKRVEGRRVAWGSPGNTSSGVVEDVTLIGADSLKLSGFSGLDVTVATYYRLQGDGEKWGVRAAVKHLGHDDDRVAELRAALVRRKPLEYQSFPCLVVRQSRKQKVPDNVPVELASLVGA
ncbi:unnamed protein product [Pelagomonas calceolata]|uniref:tRNAHis guanylyltransferase catalytic domain-containing protein n=3 Tax=Pelagomonas calceolata TaxID=35677 RepID=A0A8J2SCD4_9STRA|nr:unnamed protein product [Pelagomonas calceolata]